MPTSGEVKQRALHRQQGSTMSRTTTPNYHYISKLTFSVLKIQQIPSTVRFPELCHPVNRKLQSLGAIKKVPWCSVLVEACVHLMKMWVSHYEFDTALWRAEGGAASLQRLRTAGLSFKAELIVLGCLLKILDQKEAYSRTEQLLSSISYIRAFRTWLQSGMAVTAGRNGVEEDSEQNHHNFLLLNREKELALSMYIIFWEPVQVAPSAWLQCTQLPMIEL